MKPTAAAGQKSDCVASVFVLQDLQRAPAVPSPDGRYRVVLAVRSENDDRGVMSVYDSADVVATYQLRDLSAGVFVNWAPDSRAFYVMWSNGGTIGGYVTRVFVLSEGRTTEVPTTIRVEQEFSRQHPCPARGHNVYAIRWFGGSSEMLLALEVYPTSDCGRELGIIRGYRVRVSDGVVLQRLSERQLKGQTPPGCPSDIYPTGLWSSDDLKKAQQRIKR